MSAAFKRTSDSSVGITLGRCAAAGLLAAAVIGGLPKATHAATYYWDGTGTTWTVKANWSTVSGATTPDPTKVPGSTEIAGFSITTINTPQTVNLDANQSAVGLVFSSTSTTTLESAAGGVGSNTLTLGGSGIAVNTGAGNVAITAPMILSSGQSFNNASTVGNLNISGNMAINNGLIINNGAYAGSVTLSGTNTGAGGVTLAAGGTGTLAVTNASSLGTGPFTISGGVLDNTSGAPFTLSNALTLGSFAFTGTNDLTLAGNFTPGASTGITITANAGTLAFSGVLGGPLSIAKNGAGALTLSGANTFSGNKNVTLNAGTLNLNNVSALSGTSSGEALNITAGTLDNTSGADLTLLTTGGTGAWSGNFTFAGTYSLNLGAMAVTLTNNPTITVTQKTLTIGGVVKTSATSALTKAGNGTLVLTNTGNTYSGGTTLNAGTLSISALTNLGASAGTVTFNGGMLQITGTTVTSMGTRTVNWSTFSGGFDIASGSNTFTVSQAISGTGSLSKAGPGSLSLTASNSYSGGTTINAGTLNVSGSGTLGAPTGALTLAGGTLDLKTTSQSVGAVSITAAPASGNTIQNGNLTGTSYAVSNPSGNAIITANLLANGSAGVTMSGAGTLTLSGVNTYTGGTVINAGTIAVAADTALGAITSAVTVNNGGTLDITSAFTTTRSITLGTSGTGSPTLQVDAGTQTLAWNGTGGLTKAGSGQLNLASLPSTISVTGGNLLLAADSVHNNTVENLTSLSFSNDGTLDLTNHDLLIPGGLANGLTMASYRCKVTTQTAVTGAPLAPTTIALVSGKDYKAVGGPSTLGDNDLYGKFTYKGDANLDGKISADDYLALDVGYLFGLTGWTHGDFEQTGKAPSAQDYADIDLSYQNQNGKVAAAGEIALHAQWFGAAYTDAFSALNAPAVPEPASLALLGVAAAGLLSHRRR